jgi:cystathionine beta-lyase/cystathionine gamma-synthase
MSEDFSYKMKTKVIHAGQHPDKAYGAVMPPIYATSTYAQAEPGNHQGFEYSRSSNPTRLAYERMLAALEGGVQGFAFASGMAACVSVLDLLEPGAHVIASYDVYGGTYRLMEQVRKRSQNIECTFVDVTDLQAVAQAIRPETKLLWVESPSNPLLKIADLPALVKLAKQNNIMTVADNTFATPCLQQPLALGFDWVLHSTTKYINGHSDIVGGALITSDNALAEQMAFLHNATGAVQGPFDSYLALRGIKTLALRMKQHSESAEILADFLSSHAAIEEVFYPGLKSHPAHALAKEQMTSFGGMLSIRLKGNGAQTVQFLKSCKLFTLAESLGGVESLINLPASMTHATLPDNIRLSMGITDNLVRISVGIEDVLDLKADLEQALNTIS